MKFHWPFYPDIIFFVDHYSAEGGGGYQISIAYCLFSLVLFHYATCLCIMQGFLKAVKMIILVKNCAIFLIFAQNTDRGYTLEPYM